MLQELKIMTSLWNILKERMKNCSCFRQILISIKFLIFARSETLLYEKKFYLSFFETPNQHIKLVRETGSTLLFQLNKEFPVKLWANCVCTFYTGNPIYVIKN